MTRLTNTAKGLVAAAVAATAIGTAGVAAAQPYAAKIVTFGTDRAADVRPLETMRVASGGTFVTARVGEREVSFTIAQPGAHWVSNALAVLAAVEAVGGDLAAAGLALAEMAGMAGRGRRVADRRPLAAAVLPVQRRCAAPEAAAGHGLSIVRKICTTRVIPAKAGTQP